MYKVYTSTALISAAVVAATSFFDIDSRYASFSVHFTIIQYFVLVFQTKSQQNAKKIFVCYMEHDSVRELPMRNVSVAIQVF